MQWSLAALLQKLHGARTFFEFCNGVFSACDACHCGEMASSRSEDCAFRLELNLASQKLFLFLMRRKSARFASARERKSLAAGRFVRGAEAKWSGYRLAGGT
jgi:hypothetical protein